MSRLFRTHSVKFAVPKNAEPPTSCQDACETNNTRLLYAVADGVSNSLFPAEWASLLVNRFCSSSNETLNDLFQKKNWSKWLRPIQAEWRNQVGNIVDTRKEIPIDILNEYKSEKAAASTFIGLQLFRDGESSNRWRAIIIGDSVLFHIKGEQLLHSYDILSSAGFSNKPRYFASFMKDCLSEPCYRKGQLQRDDAFILATDGLASWLLMQCERDLDSWRRAWKSLSLIGNWDEFYKFVRSQQNDKSNLLVDDDTAIVIASMANQSTLPRDGVYGYFESSDSRNARRRGPNKQALNRNKTTAMKRTRFYSWSRSISGGKIALVIATIALILSLLSLALGIYLLFY